MRLLFLKFKFKLNFMETITALEFRQTFPEIIRTLKETGGVMVTHRGKPAGMFVPLPNEEPVEEPLSIYDLWKYAVSGTDEDAEMTNEKIDQIVYGYGRSCDP
jgi:antitoxin (DNA-binding transcriptional repressor) of toxin-antitoxin stability system